VTRPTTIEAFLDGFNRALTLSGRRRRRVIDEARDHLIEARDRGISAGLDPQAAEIGAIEAFGDPAAVASRFDPGLLARLSGAVDRFDRWRAVHTTAAITLVLAPMALVMAASWSPLVALAFLPAWAIFVWIGRQLRERHEPGYRYRLWGWKQEHPAKYQIATNGGGLLGGAAYFALQLLAGSPPQPRSWLILTLAPLILLSWLLNNPRRYQSPAAPAA
jgi:hypothetical protein